MPHNFSLNLDAIRNAVEAFKTRKTMDVVVEMLRMEPVSTQAMPPSSFARVNMELDLVSSNQTAVLPVVLGDAPTLRGSTELAIMRVVVSPD